MAATLLCAALYCVGSLLTAFIPTFFFVQFRPAVAIPAIFAVLFGPFVGGLGAAIGTFIASLIRYGTPLLTVFSGTPANFAGFWILGYVTWKLRRYRWTIAFVIGSVAGMAVGSLIIAGGLYVLAAAFGLSALFRFLNPSYAVIASFTMVFAPLPIAMAIAIPVVEACWRIFPYLKAEFFEARARGDA